MKISPKQFVELLDKKIVGQANAKKMLAISLRNRWRRMQLDAKIRKEITPKNILMIGPTGVGKTAIIRAMADIIDAPMVKVEATKYTQVGYVGATVEEMVHQLTDEAHRMLSKGGKKTTGKGVISKSKDPWNIKFDDLFKDIFADLNKEHEETTEDSINFDKEEVKKYTAIVKKTLARCFLPTAKLYGYVGTEKDLFSLDKGLYTKNDVESFKTDMKESGSLIIDLFNLPQIMMLSLPSTPIAVFIQLTEKKSPNSINP